MKLSGKIALVTGATGGIGHELCKSLVSHGVRVIATARTQEKLNDLAEEIGQDNNNFLVSDFTKVEEILSLTQKIISLTDHLDILINAAGVGIYKSIDEVELKEWEDSLTINATAPFFLTKLLLPVLKKSDTAVVLNIGSGMGKIPTACRSVYCATKYALRGMSLSLAAEFKGTNIHFVHIALGSTLTEFGPLTLQEKEAENLAGKAYFTPGWVAKKFIDIVERGEFQDEIEIYPLEYNKQ